MFKDGKVSEEKNLLMRKSSGRQYMIRVLRRGSRAGEYLEHHRPPRGMDISKRHVRIFLRVRERKYGPLSEVYNLAVAPMED
ncbi:hypothetical protein BD779DRAFT_1220383 [Infundibulicybe gibba]|nr:hypothetical protein BD779DRAFT_1220383 [Infundibulicybe gibba]